MPNKRPRRPPSLLLDQFRELFQSTEYHHRRANLGDRVAQYLYEDLHGLGQSAKFDRRVAEGHTVLNVANRTQGVEHRRGDGSFGTIVPGEEPIRDSGFHVARGRIANIEIGTEVKIISKAMIRQVDRVISDLHRQVQQFRRSNRSVITVGIVGVNHADRYRSIEGEREYISTGEGRHLHPIQEAAKAIIKLQDVRAAFDEFLIFRFRATNLPPFPFQWLDETEVRRGYSAALVRIAAEYERRFCPAGTPSSSP